MQKRKVQEDLWVEERLASLEPALTAQGLSIAELYRLSSLGDNKIRGVMPSIGLDPKADPLVIAVKRVRKALADEDKAAKEAPQPRYILECRRPFGRLLQPFINEDRLRWDSYTIGKIIQDRLRDVFAPLLGCDELEARELLTDLILLVERRTLRAHDTKPTEREVLDALATMGTI